MPERLAQRTTHKPVPSNPQGIGRRTDTSPLPLTAAPHNNAIESLRQELLGKINGQANDIRKLKSSNEELKLSNNGLKLRVNGLTSSNTELTSKVDGLTLLNADLLEKVRHLAASNTDMSSTLQNVS
jgi:hypothetical protein